MDQITLALVFTSAGAGIVGGFVAAVIEAVKPGLPDTWSHGRAPMLMALGLSVLIVLLALWEAGSGFSPSTIFAFLFMTYTVYAAAVGSHATVSKAVAVVQNRTNTAGPDEVVIRDTDTP